MLFLFLFVFGFTIKLSAQGNSLLWKISGPAVKGNSYLFGTIHLSDNEIKSKAESVFCFIDSTKTLAGELDLLNINQNEILKSMKLPEGTSLKTIYNADDFELIRNVFFKAAGMPVEMVLNFKPFAVYALAVSSKFRSMPVDMMLFNYAKEKGYKSFGLETIEEQMVLADSISNDMILDSFRNWDQEMEKLNVMIDFYIKEDINEINNMVLADSSFEGISVIFLERRNSIMAERLLKLIYDNPLFIAVGAAHLPGQEGLINILRKNGLTVEAVIR